MSTKSLQTHANPKHSKSKEKALPQPAETNLKENLSTNLTGLSSSTLKRISLANQTRIQSQLFTVSRTLNPLVAAAGPLLTMATRLGELQSTPEIDLIREQLAHEVKAFEYKAQSLGYRPQVVIAARYLVCTLIDETIQNSSWGKQLNWNGQNLLQDFQGESDGSERCFYILERSFEDPILYLDLIELSYLCLSLGLEGKFRGQRNGSDDLNTILDHLYQLIRHHRGEPSRQLMITHDSTSKPHKMMRWRVPPVWLTVTLSALLLLAIYWPYHQQLESLADPVDQTLKTLNTFANQNPTTEDHEKLSKSF